MVIAVIFKGEAPQSGSGSGQVVPGAGRVSTVRGATPYYVGYACKRNKSRRDQSAGAGRPGGGSGSLLLL